MRRAVLVFLLGVCVFAGAALAGFYAASQLAPERLRSEAENRLGSLLHAPVRLGAVRVSLTEDLPWLQLQAEALRADPLPGGSALTVETVSARVDPFLLMLGRLELRGLRLAGIELAMPAPAAAEPSAEDPVSRAIAELTRAGEQLRAKPCPIPPLDAERLALALTSASAPRRVLELDRAAFRCSRIRRTGSWEVSGRVLLTPAAALPFALEVEASAAEVEVSLTAESTPLAALMQALQRASELRGLVSGELRWRSTPGAPHELQLAVRGRSVQGALSPGSPAEGVALDLREPSFEAKLTASAAALRAMSFRLADGKLAITGEGSLALPISDESALHLALAARDVERSDLAHVSAQLPKQHQPNLQRALSRVVGGRIKSLALEVHSRVAGVKQIARDGALARPGDLSLEASVENGEILVGESDRLRDLTGTFDFSGNELELHALGARFEERRLPRLSATVTGISHLRSLEDIHCDRPPAVPPLRGIDDVRAWIESRRKPPYLKTWSKLELEALRVAHPALFCTLGHAVAQIDRVEGGSDVSVKSGTWAGFEIAAHASYRKRREKDGQPSRDGGSILLDLALGKPSDPAPPTASPAASWAEGRFALDVTSMGRFLTRGYDGSFRATDAELELYDSRLQLAPSGELLGRLVLELGEHGPTPFEVDAQTRGLDLLDVWKTSQVPRPVMSGTLIGAATLSGHLQLGKSPLVDVAGYGSLHARKGEIYRSVPFLLALAMSDEKINPFGKRDRFPYKAIDLDGPVEGGWLFSRTLALEGKSERMAASGKTHLAEPYELEGVVGMYPIPTLDSIVSAIPIVNVLLLGEDQALAGFYFSVTGVWTKPTVQALPIKSIASGPASLVLEGVPNFVLGGLRALGSVLAPPAPAKPRAAPKAKPAEIVEPSAS